MSLVYGARALNWQVEKCFGLVYSINFFNTGEKASSLVTIRMVKILSSLQMYEIHRSSFTFLVVIFLIGYQPGSLTFSKFYFAASCLLLLMFASGNVQFSITESHS